NQRRIARGKPSIIWPMEMLEVPAWQDSSLSADRVRIARIACTMTKAEKDALRDEFGRKCGTLGGDHFQDVQYALGAWENGEEKRDINFRLEVARQKASDIIEHRQNTAQLSPLDFAECFRTFGPEGGCFHGASQWRPELWNKLTSKDQMPFRKQWERAERLLPVYYEYARQSVKLLSLAVIHVTIEQEMPSERAFSVREGSSPRLGGCAMHPLEFEERRCIVALHSRIGGYAEAVIKSLGKFLVKDLPYTQIPLNERKWAVSFAMSCNEHHQFMGPMLTDAGPVFDPWVMGQVEREKVRLARTDEATQTAEIDYRVIIAKEEHDKTIGHQDVIRYDKALLATTQDQKVINKRTKQTAHFRAFDSEGGEVLALKINWRDTRDSELAEAFLELIKSLRPQLNGDRGRYSFLPEADLPERPASKQRGSKWETEAKAALNALIELQKKQAAHNAWRAAKDEAARLQRDLKRGGWCAEDQARLEVAIQDAKSLETEMGAKSKALTLPGNKRSIASACFRKIVGDDESPWWEKCA
ncbi:MAG TPA: hypothetical protein DCP71_07880, partial [Verrucomicrobiales bacterium]|nr:hypothetical protein [Verrucomicrobiales bacterium]